MEVYGVRMEGGGGVKIGWGSSLPPIIDQHVRAKINK